MMNNLSATRPLIDIINLLYKFVSTFGKMVDSAQQTSIII